MLLRPAATGRVRGLTGDLPSQHARSCRSTSHQQNAICAAHRHLRVRIVSDAMLSENRQKLFFAFPGKQVVLSLQHAWLDIPCQSQILLPQPLRLLSTLTFPLHNLHQLLDLIRRKVTNSKPLELPSPVRLIHRSRLFFQRSDSVRHMEVQNVNLLSVQLFLAGCEAVSNILKRVWSISQSADLGADSGPAEVLLRQSLLTGTEVVDGVGGGCIELDMAVLAEEIKGLLEVVADEGVADAAGAEDDFGGLVGRHCGDVG